MPSSWAAVGAEHRDRLAGGGGVEVAALGDAGAGRGGQAQAGGGDGQRVGVDRGDQRAAVGVGAADRAGVLDGGDAGQLADHARRGVGQLGGPPEKVCPLVTVSRLVPRADLGEQPGLGGAGQAEDGDDRGHPDRDAQRGQRARSLRVRSPTLASPARSAGAAGPRAARAGSAADVVVMMVLPVAGAVAAEPGRCRR